MATKVKPTRLNISGTPQAGDVPVYVDSDCFCWGSGGAGAVIGPSSSCDGDIAIFCGTCGDCIVDSGEKLCNLAQCCDIPTDNCQLSNGCGYTTCTGTLVPSDIQNLAQCCDIPTDNCQLTNGCGYTTCTGTVVDSDLACYVQCCDMPNMSCYQTKDCMVCDLTGADNTHYPSAKAVADALSCAGAGDMLKSTYDPNNHNADAFDYCNFTNTPTIPTDNCQLANGCGYTTCTGTLSSCSDVISALGFTPYNCTNPAGYTTCTGTLVASDIQNLAQCCDIPTNNCQLTNGCGYTTCTGTVSTCADVISALGYTPYNCTNPAGYTTCTGTVVASDLIPYAKSCDIACVNGCCLTNGGNITISGGADYSRCTQTISGGNVTLCLRTIVDTPTSNFTLTKPATLLDGEEYAIRVISGTSYCMCLGSCFTNPRNVDTTLSGNATDQYVFLAIGGELELQPLVDTGA